MIQVGLGLHVVSGMTQNMISCRSQFIDLVNELYCAWCGPRATWPLATSSCFCIYSEVVIRIGYKYRHETVRG